MSIRACFECRIRNWLSSLWQSFKYFLEIHTSGKLSQYSTVSDSFDKHRLPLARSAHNFSRLGCGIKRKFMFHFFCHLPVWGRSCHSGHKMCFLKTWKRGTKRLYVLTATRNTYNTWKTWWRRPDNRARPSLWREASLSGLAKSTYINICFSTEDLLWILNISKYVSIACNLLLLGVSSGQPFGQAHLWMKVNFWKSMRNKGYLAQSLSQQDKKQSPDD